MAGNVVDKERFRQLVKAGLPVNPVSGVEIVGANMSRLQAAMASFGWKDPRFVSAVEAERNGWAIGRNAASVQALIRTSGSEIDTVKLYNADTVQGMPALATMLEWGDAELAALQDHEGAELHIGPARPREKAPEITKDAALAGAAPAVEAAATAMSSGDMAPGAAPSGRYAVMAPYWLDGLHNAEGLALAAELNGIINANGLARDSEAIARLMKGRERALMLELAVVPEERLLGDPMMRRNPAEPEFLLDGELARDKEGAYRPKAGGRVVLEDKGDSLVVKGKSEQSYKAAIELAVAKGWTAIELSGKATMLADAWLEAKMQGLDVVNYSPTKEDEKRFAERMAKETAGREVQTRETIVQTPEFVELRPFVDAAGHNKMAVMTYTVTQDGAEDVAYDNPTDAAKHFASVSESKTPAVIRSVVRADGEVKAEVMVAGTGLGTTPGSLHKSADATLDREFSEVLSEILSEKANVVAVVDSAGQAGTAMYSGMILRIEGNNVVQKVGRDPGQVVYHDISKLSRMPKVGEVEDIRFGKDGIGVVAERGQGLELN